LLILKVLTETHFIMLVAAFRKPPVPVKLAPETGRDTESCTVNHPLLFYLGGFFLHPMIAKHWRKSTNDRVRKPDRKSDAAFGLNFRIGKGFYISKHNLHVEGTSFHAGGGGLYFISRQHGSKLGRHLLIDANETDVERKSKIFNRVPHG
jgi:hypothetical protein